MTICVSLCIFIDTTVHAFAIKEDMNFLLRPNLLTEVSSGTSANNRIKEALMKWYFRPKFFEIDGRLYKILGVKVYLNLYSKFMFKIDGTKVWVDIYSKESLRREVKLREKIEILHVFGAIFCSIPACVVGALVPPIGAIVAVGVTIIGNIIVNVYPVMLQRHIRSIFYRRLLGKERRSAGAIELNNHIRQLQENI